MMTKSRTVAEYIAAAPKEARPALRQLRAILKRVAPKAHETLKWGSPVLEDGRILFSYSAYKSHLNFMPTRSALAPFRKELTAYTTGRDTMQLPYGKPLPKGLIRRIAQFRVREVRDQGSLWMHRGAARKQG